MTAVSAPSVWFFVPVVAFLLLSPAQGQSPAVDSPMSRMRPIGTYGQNLAKAQQVDQLSRTQPASHPRSNLRQVAARQTNMNSLSSSIRETGYQARSGQQHEQGASQPRVANQQTVRLQQFESPLPTTALPLPGGGVAAPNGGPAGSAAQNPSLPPGPVSNTFGGGEAPGSGQVLGQTNVIPNDQMPIPAPQLTNGFATISNCNCVSGPSSYSAASFGGCAPASYQTPAFPQVQTVPGQGVFGTPTVLPNGLVPQSPLPGAGVPGGALISFGQQTNSVVVGQGLLGQPVAYVPGQTFRNWLRYFSP